MESDVPMSTIHGESSGVGSVLGLGVISANGNSVGAVTERECENSRGILRAKRQRSDVGAIVGSGNSAGRRDQLQRRQFNTIKPSSAGGEPYLMVGSRP